ncbi:MAG: ParB/RepB/Spo0J family partition protein [Candidatus Eisenbacteria bacterium]|nr:ParB/RepB/Spo0J family partition protein [Candidatus Eisenbacteria bacterium]
MARKVLGQGLRALIPEDSRLPGASGAEQALTLVPLDRIAPNPHQPRQRFNDDRISDLAQSIREQGILQPIVVRRTEGNFEVVVGERRVRAARLAGLDAVPAVVKDGLEPADLLALALVENIQREDLDPIEEAQAYRELMERGGMTQQEVAAKVGKSREAIANTLRLLNLSRDLQRLVAEGGLSAGHARALLAAPAARRPQLAELARSLGLSVRQLERRARESACPRVKGSPDPNVAALETELEELFAARVKLTCHGKAGRLEVRFQSFEELDRIVALLRRGTHR